MRNSIHLFFFLEGCCSCGSQTGAGVKTVEPQPTILVFIFAVGVFVANPSRTGNSGIEHLYCPRRISRAAKCAWAFPHQLVQNHRTRLRRLQVLCWPRCRTDPLPACWLRWKCINENRMTWVNIWPDVSISFLDEMLQNHSTQSSKVPDDSMLMERPLEGFKTAPFFGGCSPLHWLSLLLRK